MQFLARTNDHKLSFSDIDLLALRSMLFSSVLIWLSKSIMLDAAKVTFVSSAYILWEPRLKQFDQKEKRTNY